MGDQRVVGAIADIRGFGKVGFLAALSRRLDDMLGIIEARAIKSAGLDRSQQLYRRHRLVNRRPLISGERIAAHLGDHVTLDDPVSRMAFRLVPYPAHRSVSSTSRPQPVSQSRRLASASRLLHDLVGIDTPDVAAQ